LRSTTAIFALIVFLLFTPRAFAQVGARTGAQQQGPTISGAIIVRVQLPDKSPYDNAIVNLRTFNGLQISMQTTVGQGQANFQDLPRATYNIEVMAPGFETITQSVEIVSNGDQQFITMMLKPLPGTDISIVRSGPPILAPGAQKELNKAMEALRSDKPEEAKKHLDKAIHSAPSNPDVNYMLGMYYAQQKDYAHAEEYWKKAIQIYPLHTYSLSALGSLEKHEFALTGSFHGECKNVAGGHRAVDFRSREKRFTIPLRFKQLPGRKVLNLGLNGVVVNEKERLAGLLRDRRLRDDRQCFWIRLTLGIGIPFHCPLIG